MHYKMNDKELQENFTSGNHRKLIDQFLGNHSKFEVSNAHLMVGSLTFLGQLNEARIQFEKYEKVFNQFQIASCQFYLGLGECRIGNYENSYDIFTKNFEEFHSSSDSQILFFCHQGYAFYYYYSGNFKKAEEFAYTSLKHSLSSNDRYGQLLATDLMGHVFIQRGHLYAGLQYLESALSLGEVLNIEGHKDTIEASLLIYRAEYGLLNQDVEEILEKKIKDYKIRNQDNYTLSNLYLELSRQHSVRGSPKKALEMANQASFIIFSHRNRRQGIVLNLRYAHIYYQQGQSLLALNFLRNAQMEIDCKVDTILNIKALEMEYSIKAKIDNSAIKDKRIGFLSEQSGQQKALRIFRRGENDRSNLGCKTDLEDRLGFLLDQVFFQMNKEDLQGRAELIIKSGFHSFLYDVLGVEFEQDTLYLDLIPDSFTILTKGEVVVLQQELTKGMRTLLLSLFDIDTNNKESLIKKIWGYENYDSQIHDNLLYVNISRLRSLLGEYSKWIIYEEGKYSIKNGVQLKKISPTKIEINDYWETANFQQNDKLLNQRQIEILNYLKKHPLIGVKEHKEIYKLSDITASRDLSELAQKNIIQRIGRGPATKYTLRSIQ